MKCIYKGDDAPNLIEIELINNYDYQINKLITTCGKITHIYNNPVFPFSEGYTASETLQFDLENTFYAGVEIEGLGFRTFNGYLKFRACPQYVKREITNNEQTNNNNSNTPHTIRFELSDGIDIEAIFKIDTDETLWGGISGDITDQTDLQNALNDKQDTLTAGEGISIEDNVISNTQTSAEWGNIQGNIADQTDLNNLIDSKVGEVAGDLTIEETARGNADDVLDGKIGDNKTAIDNHIADKTNPHEVSKAQVGLGNVDNTSDLNKPISTATQTALDGKVDKLSTKPTAGTYTKVSINAEGQVTSGTTLSESDIPNLHLTKVTDVTSTATEVNQLHESGAVKSDFEKLHAITASATELNTLDGITASTSELNILDGATVTTNELNVLDGITASTTELNYTDGVTSNIQSQLDGKVPTSRTVNSKALTSDINLTASDVNALPDTTTINDLTTAEQQSALNSGANSTNIGQIATNTQNISNEVTNRQNADNNLQSQIDALVVASDVFDIVGTYAELQAYDISTVPVNDIIKVLVDSTHDNAATYYRCVENDNVKSWSYIGAEGAYYTKSESDSLFVEQTTTINGQALSNNITLTASDVGALPDSTTIGNGTLTIQKNGSTVKTFTANASSDVTCNITVPTKTSDLINDEGYTTNTGTITGITMNGVSKGTSGVVDLGTVITDVSGKVNTDDLSAVAFSGDYDDLTDKPTIPTVGNGTITITQGGTTKGTFTTNQSGNSTIELDAAGVGTVTDVQVNGTSVTSSGVANIVTNTAYNSSTNKIATMSDLPSISDCVKKSGGSSKQTISLTSGAGTAPIGLKAASSHACYLSFDTSSGWVGSYGVSSDKAPIFDNGTVHILAKKSDIPTNVSAFTNDSGYITGISSSDVTTALGYTPYDSSNPNGYTSNTGTVTSVNNVQPVNGNVTLSIPDAQVNSDWNATSGKAQILNKPSLSTVATSGSYTDLSDKPTIATSVSASSTNAETVGAKLFYDTCGDIETLINNL